MLNPGNYNKKISIYKVAIKDDSAGFKTPEDTLILTTYAKVKTTNTYENLSRRESQGTLSLQSQVLCLQEMFLATPFSNLLL